MRGFLEYFAANLRHRASWSNWDLNGRPHSRRTSREVRGLFAQFGRTSPLENLFANHSTENIAMV